jgi:hypothetical protein
MSGAAPAAGAVRGYVLAVADVDLDGTEAKGDIYGTYAAAQLLADECNRERRRVVVLELREVT